MLGKISTNDPFIINFQLLTMTNCLSPSINFNANIHHSPRYIYILKFISPPHLQNLEIIYGQCTPQPSMVRGGGAREKKGACATVKVQWKFSRANKAHESKMRKSNSPSKGQHPKAIIRRLHLSQNTERYNRIIALAR